MANSTFPIFEPPGMPLAGMRTSPHPLVLAPGEQSLIRNLRWGETGSPIVRQGVAQYLDAPFSVLGGGGLLAANSIVDIWAGELNGVPTYVVVAAFNADMRVFASQNGVALTELTVGSGAWFGDATGNTRFPTVTTRATMCAVRTPGGLESGSPVLARDALVIQNGVDSPRIWDPGAAAGFQFTVHDPLSIPSNSASFRYSAGLSRFAQVAGTGGKTYPVDGGANSTSLNWANSTTSDIAVSGATAASPIVLTVTGHGLTSGDQRYVRGVQGLQGANGFFTVTYVDANHVSLNGSTGVGAWTFGGVMSAMPYYDVSTVPVLTVTTAVNVPFNFPAVISFAAPFTVTRQLLMVVEGQPNASALDILNGCRIEISGDVAAYATAAGWKTVYDPSSNDGVTNSFAAYAFDSNPNRWMVVFRADALPAGQVLHHIKFTWTGSSPGAAVNRSMALLMLASAGGYPGGTQWVMAYEDSNSKSESYGIEASAVDAARLNAVGGPASVASQLPMIQAVLYDYSLVIPNTAQVGFMAGGLNKSPDIATLYMRLPGQTQALYGFGLIIFNAVTSGGVVNGWLPAHVGATFTITTDQLSFFTKNLADPTRPSPSTYQISIPPSNASCWASNRLFVGDVYQINGNRAQSDVYFSSASLAFRFSSVPIDGQGNEDMAGGSRATFAGERVQALVAAASMAEGASFIYVLSDSALHMLGGGGILGGQTDARSLATPHRVGSLGTNSWRTVRERNGVIMWLDQEGTVRRLYGGIPQDVSRKHVDDRVRGIPAAYRSEACAIWTRDRYYLSYTPAGATTNTKMLVWFDPGQTWESEDLPPVSYQRLATLYDPATDGSGRKLLGAGSDRKTYWHETGTVDLALTGVPWRIDTRELNFGSGKSGNFDETIMLTDPVANGLVTIDRLYRPSGSLYRSTLALDTGFGTDAVTAETEVVAPADAAGERGATARMHIYGTLPGGTSIVSIVGKAVSVSSSEPYGGS